MNFHPFQGLQDLPDLPDAAHASREDLVAEMLGLQAHPLPGPTPAALRVSDRETPHEDPATRSAVMRTVPPPRAPMPDQGTDPGALCAGKRGKGAVTGTTPVESTAPMAQT